MSVGWLVGWSVGRVTHLFDDPHGALHCSTWPCLRSHLLNVWMNIFVGILANVARAIITNPGLGIEML